MAQESIYIASKEKELRNAAADGNLSMVVSLITENPQLNINSSSSNGNTALAWAIERGNKIKSEGKILEYFGIILFLLSKKSDYSHLLKDFNPESTKANDSNAPSLKFFLSYLYQRSTEEHFLLLCTSFFESINFKHDANMPSILEGLEIMLRVSPYLINRYKRFLSDLIQSNSNKVIRVLDVACGEILSVVFLRFIAKIHNKTIQFIAVDNNATYLTYCRTLYTISTEQHFIEADATKPQELARNNIEPKSFDLILLRNPNFEAYNQTFTQITQNLFLFIKDTGKLLFSFYPKDFDIFYRKMKEKYFEFINPDDESDKDTIIRFTENSPVFTSKDAKTIPLDRYMIFITPNISQALLKKNEVTINECWEIYEKSKKTVLAPNTGDELTKQKVNFLLK